MLGTANLFLYTQVDRNEALRIYVHFTPNKQIGTVEKVAVVSAPRYLNGLTSTRLPETFHDQAKNQSGQLTHSTEYHRL